MSNISMMSTRVLRPKNADLVRPLTTSRKQSSLFGRVQKRLKPKKFVFCSLAVLVTYVMCTIPLTEKQARLLLEERYRLRELITIDEGDGMCDIGSPVEDAPNHPSPNSTRTLLAAYPGSGKRFTWTIIKALTNYEVADDWNFSGKLGKNPLTIKTSWPHSEGVWTWGSDMDQVLLLMRNPRKAVPSYHTLRWELDYAKDWASCFRRIPDTYMERPPVNKWEAWRNGKAFGEIDSWFAFHDFWMQGGFVESWNMTHFRCDPNEKGYSIDCQPKQVVDFESLYSSSITDDFERIGGLLDASRDVEPIAQQARACVLHNVFNRTGHQDLNMHQASRPSPELTSEYNFTLPQYAKLMNRTIDLRDKYTEEPLASIPHADNFVRILNRYINENTNEFYDVVDNYLKDHVTKISFPGTGGDCNTLEGVEVTICNFIKYKENHGIFFDGFYPLRFPYSNWLKERAVLLRMYLNNGGSAWTSKGGWFSTDDHCSWEGVTCAELEDVKQFRVVELSLPNNQLEGSFPLDLTVLSALKVLDLSSNAITGDIPSGLCDRAEDFGLKITGDAANCPNSIDVETGEYLHGCCTVVKTY